MSKANKNIKTEKNDLQKAFHTTIKKNFGSRKNFLKAMKAWNKVLSNI